MQATESGAYKLGQDCFAQPAQPVHAQHACRCTRRYENGALCTWNTEKLHEMLHLVRAGQHIMCEQWHVEWSRQRDLVAHRYASCKATLICG